MSIWGENFNPYDTEPWQREPECCEICGRSGDIDHGAEHMGAVEFPENTCEACWRDREAAKENR